MASTLADRPALPRRLRTYRKRQRGIILLMVVSLLALFLLMGVTFAILAIQYKTAADTQAGKDRYGDPMVPETDLGLTVVLSDSMGRSSLRGHSLLRDLYGTDYVQTNVSGNPLGDPRKTCNGHFTVFPINPSAAAGTLINTPGYYNSRVITFITGAAAGFSSRIAGYDPVDPTTGNAEVYIEPLVGNSGLPIQPANGDVFVINGAPFNGMGFGLDSGTWRLDAVDSSNRPVSLMPHFAGYGSLQANSSSGGSTFDFDLGGADEPWDAPDLQNLHISVVPPGLLDAAVAGNPPNRFSLPLIPSFHRPELVNFWLDASRWPGGSNIQLTDPNQKNLARQIIFRPMPWDHTNFTGSNPALTPASNNDAGYAPLMELMAQRVPGGGPQSGAANSGGPQWRAVWDVDNDGDGVPDSVWVDLGLPVMTSASGRRYKRLHAILIKDLDGRINLNVHGNLGQARVSSQASIDYPFHVFGGSVQPPPPAALPVFPHNRNSGFTATRQLQLPRGMGFGPAEVDYRWLLGTASLTGDYGPLLVARYGDGQPGISGTDDAMSVVKMYGVPGNYLNDSWYGSLPDVWGRNAVAVDFGGRPFFYRESINSTSETADDPYEMQWDPATAIADTPYNIADMERLARAHDSDIGQFPARLPTVSSALFTGAGQPASSPTHQRLRESFTMMSSYIPTTPSILRPDHRQSYVANGLGNINAFTVIDLYRQRYAEVPGGAAILGNPNTLRAELGKILPWEFWQGKPLDLNRYLSNGQNENGNAANGEPLEASTNETAFVQDPNGAPNGPLPSGFSGVQAYHSNSVDANNDNLQDGTTGPSLTDRVLARQVLARHLYCLMMAVNGFNTTSNNAYYPPNVGSNAPSAATTARLFAQWAVNIVDFRDTDGIMTPFEYDINPWDGWSVDGNPATTTESDRGVVFGCEAPELILMESLALHDRRVKDTRFDTTGKERNEMQNPDDDVDQFRIPQGSLFFELYCPRTHNSYSSTAASDSIYNPHMPFELYDRNTGRLDLARTAPDGSPVWQVAIGQLQQNAGTPGFPPYQTQNANQWEDAFYADPANPNPLLLQYNYNGQTVNIDRYVWFTTNLPPTGIPRHNRDRGFYNVDRYSALLSPGQYMLVGPRTNTYLGSNKVNNGSGSGFWGGNSFQRITLSKTAGVEVMDAMNNLTSRISTTPATAEIQPTAAMAVMTRPPDTWTGAKRAAGDYTHWRGVNITEPLPNVVGGPVSFYPEYNTTNDGRNPFDAYDDPAAPTNVLPDTPMDNSRLIGNASMLQTRNYPDRSAIFLQRLADPTRPWNAFDNPYITVDFASVDVSVFTGEEDTTRTFRRDPNDPAEQPQSIDPSDPSPAVAGGVPRPTRYNTLQRAQNPQARGNPWYPTFTDTDVMNPPPQSSAEAYFNLPIYHTFGYLNEDLGTVRDAGPSGDLRSYIGDPTDGDKPFPWIAWHNRPYMNSAELLLVPTSSPNRLVLEISPDNQTIPTNAGANPYSPAAGDGRALRQPFAHLMNMFESGNGAQSMNLSRLLDYVEVPSNFVGTERWYTPSNMSNIAPSPGNPAPVFVPPYLYRPPFNKLSRFRDPGRININTIFEPSIWNSIVGYDASTGVNGVQTPTLVSILQSRQGYGGGTYASTQYPTMFANPFRPADASDLMPNVADMRTRTPAEVSFFRPSPANANQPLFAHRSQQNANDTDRHAYFRYQGLQKLGNILSTQSNCYAVWITVGYFEVDSEDPLTGMPVPIDAAHPDGFMLGQELGIDLGDTQRHRAFYLIDRSIPVGFVPGLKLNSENVVLLKRQIE